MSDEYLARYQGLSHEQLWNELQAGSPGQVDSLAAAWKSLHDTATALATSLTRDLGRLAAGWSSSSGTEYQNRLAFVSSYSSTLAAGFADRHRELTLMAGALRTAQRQAEDPAATDDNDQMWKDAGIGFVLGGPVGGVVGGFLGHNQDEAEQQKARQRMVQVVAGLAADYAVTTEGSWHEFVPLAPDGMPGDDTSGVRFDPATGPRGKSTRGVGATGTASVGLHTVSDPHAVSPAPQTGSGSPQNGPMLGPDGRPIEPVTVLAGAGGLAGAVAAGLGALTAAPPVGSGGGLGIGALGAGYPFGGAASAAGAGSSSAALLGDAGGRDPRGAGARLVGRQNAASGGADDESDERMTWLTEDDMVWGASGAAAPPVLGQRPAAEQDPQ